MTELSRLTHSALTKLSYSDGDENSRMRMLIPIQAAAATFALVLLAVWPPMSGDLLLVPLGTSDVNAVAKSALAGGAALRGAGPFSGSVVVVGDRSNIARHVRSWNVVIMAAPPAGCRGSGPSKDVT